MKAVFKNFVYKSGNLPCAINKFQYIYFGHVSKKIVEETIGSLKILQQLGKNLVHCNVDVKLIRKQTTDKDDEIKSN